MRLTSSSTYRVLLLCVMSVLTNIKNSARLITISGVKGTQVCRYDQHRNCTEYGQTILSKLSQIKFACDSESIDPQIDCNCLSPCDEILYDADLILKDYQRDEIERSATGLEG